ncbi:MAG: magnesium transporter [Candidatus Methanoplasma sp.]|jgi:mgtE-like transporter|nr:magnesium transporter [Candidatus Methanoplasma sp.]
MVFVTGFRGFVLRNRSVFRMGLAALVIAATADLVAGLFLGGMEEYIVLIPGMMVLVYSAIGMRGNIFGAMGSRLGTSMHMGTFEMSFKRGSTLRSNIESSIALTFVISLAMGIMGWAIITAMGTESDIWGFTFISMTGGLLAGLVLLVFNVTIAREGHKRDWDVDNITAPLIAAAGDIVTMPMLFVSAWLVMNYNPSFFSIGDNSVNLVVVLTVVMIIVTFIIMGSVLSRKAKTTRMDEAKRILIQSTPILLMCLVLDIFAGLAIEGRKESLVELTVLLILMPAFLNEGNALSGMLTSRLSSMLHLGTLKADRFPGRDADENFAVTYILAAVTFAFIGVIASVATLLVYDGGLGIGFWQVMLIVLLAGMITTTVLNFLSYYVAIAAVKFNLDPDDHSIPITSSSMDLISALVLIGVILLLAPL